MKTIEISDEEQTHLLKAINYLIVKAADPENILCVEMAENSITLSLALKTKIKQAPAVSKLNIWAWLKKYLDN